VQATRSVATEAARIGARLIHVSSDMVLDGVHAPFDESAEAEPVHEYGRWKARAETIVKEAHPEAAIVRASLMTSFDPPDPRTEWVLSGLRGDAGVALFVDEIRTPIHVEDLARQIWEIARLRPADAAGIWHLAAPEAFSRFSLGALIAAAYGRKADPIVASRAAASSEPRPRDLRLACPRATEMLLTRPRTLSAYAAEHREMSLETKLDR
jgi:dTDP-4-dehydrorhamnose reductase